MPQVGWVDSENKVIPFDQALAEAEAYGTFEELPYEVLYNMHSNLTKERPDGISVTQLLGCPRKVYLENKIDYAVPPQENYAQFRGMVVHAVLDIKQGENVTAEQRVFRTHRGVEISGQPDNLRVVGTGSGRTLLRDWKSTKELPRFDNAYTAHQEQVNLYRWLLNLDPATTDLELVYLSMEGVKIIPLKRGGTNRYGRAIPNQVWTDEQVEAFLDKKLMILNAQRKHDAPVAYHNVDEEDLWACAYCPVRVQCYARAADEMKDAFVANEEVDRVTPRERTGKKGKK